MSLEILVGKVKITTAATPAFFAFLTKGCVLLIRSHTPKTALKYKTELNIDFFILSHLAACVFVGLFVCWGFFPEVRKWVLVL